MADRYYLLSKDIGDGPYLMGLLTRPNKGEYQFRYMISGTDFPEWFMEIPHMEDIDKTYGTQFVQHLILYRMVPAEGTWGADILMKQSGVSEYDEWEMLESLIVQHELYKINDAPLCDSHQLFYFYEEIPAHANRFD